MRRYHLRGFVLGSLALTGIAAGQLASFPSRETASIIPSEAGGPGPSSGRESLERPSDATIDRVPLADLHPLPAGKSTLIGGTLEKLDRVRDVLTVRAFGGSGIKLQFDPRTRIYRDGKAASPADLKPGERIYVDTILEGTAIFARGIRFHSNSPDAESEGAVVSYHADQAELWVRDPIFPEALRVRLAPSTRLVQGDKTVSASQLTPGTLVAVKFDPEKTGPPVAREISVLAFPGSDFTFSGSVVAVNLRTGVLILTSATDHKDYEIHFDPENVSGPGLDELRQGAEKGDVISVVARFDGTRYTAQDLSVDSPSVDSPSKQ